MVQGAHLRVLAANDIAGLAGRFAARLAIGATAVAKSVVSVPLSQDASLTIEETRLWSGLGLRFTRVWRWLMIDWIEAVGVLSSVSTVVLPSIVTPVDTELAV